MNETGRERSTGIGDLGDDVRLCGRLRQGVKGAAMILLAAVVTVLLFAYLLAVLLRPEWF